MIVLQEHAENIAKALGEGWKRSTRFDETDSSWRAELEGPDNQVLFLSSTWAGKQRLYIAGSIPQGTEWPYQVTRPEITVNIEKSAQQVARDITKRLIPDYLPKLAEVLKRKAERETFESNRKSLADQVAEITGGRVKEEMVYTGNWDLQVSGPESIRVQGHCNYLTLEQLKKINEVCPELFRKAIS